MSTVAQLLNSIPQQQARPRQSGGDLMSTLADVGGAGLGAVASVGNFLDLPGSSIRDILAGQNPLDQWMSPLSDVNRTSGRQLLEKYGMRANKETGLMGWLSDPGEGLRDLAGFGAEVALDPFGPVTKFILGAPARAATETAQAVKATGLHASHPELINQVSAWGRAHPVAKAVAKGAKFVFDTVPEKMTAPLARTLASTGRNLKSLLNKSSEGITSEVVMPYAEMARTAAEKYAFDAKVQFSELATTAENSGFHLDVDDTLDMSNSEHMLNSRSIFRVRNREDQIRAAFEGVYDPTDAAVKPRDLVTLGENPAPREVEFVSRSNQGTQVKLVGDDNIYNDWDVKPHYVSTQREVIPQQVLDVIGRIKASADSVNSRLEELGYSRGEWIDPYADWAKRRKSNELRQAEQILGANAPDFIRRGNKALADTLVEPGSRELTLGANKRGSEGVKQLYNDGVFKNIIQTLADESVVKETNKLHTSILPNVIAPKHLEDLAQSLGRTGADLFDELQHLTPVNKTNTVAYTVQDGLYDIVSNGQRVAQLGVQMADDAATIAAAHFPPDHFDDAMQYVEHDLATKGVPRVRVQVTPETADVLKKRGYSGDKMLEDGTELWSKPLYSAERMTTDRPLTMPIEQFKSVFKNWVDWQSTQVKDGSIPGVQPARGRWKKWTDLKPDANGAERIINFGAENFRPVDLNNLKSTLFDFANNGVRVEDYDIARAALESGKEVHVGVKPAGRGKPAEFVMITPVLKAQVESRAGKFLAGLDDMVGSDPVSVREAAIDSMHQTIRRNYGDMVDQWMPKLGEKGIIKAVTAGGVEHAQTLRGWHSTFEDISRRASTDKDVAGTAANRMLLSMDDDSLKALMFRDEQIAKINDIRETLDEFPRDSSIELVDRHRALAIDMAENVERRYMPMYSRSAGADQLDYIIRSNNAVQMLDATANFIVGAVKSGMDGSGGDIGKLTDDIAVTYDPTQSRGLTLKEAIEQKFFPERLNTGTYLENIRQRLVAGQVFPGTDDADKIAAQLNTIKSLRLPADTWTQLKTFNENFSGELPEMQPFLRAMGSFTALFKSWQLGSSPSTAVRDGLSSVVSATVMGDMNPVTAFYKYQSKARSFIRGASVPIDTPVKELDEYLVSRGLKVTPQARGEAFQNFWNAYTMSGSLHPNVVTADAARMAETELTSDLVGKKPPTMQDFIEGVKRTVLHPIRTFSPTHFLKDGNIFNPKVPGTWTQDELGRVVQRSVSENPLVEANNNLRGMIDNTIRAVYVMDRMAKTGSVADAFAAADKFLLNADPTKFTRFETKWLKSLIPFYSFMRQSLPLYMSEMMVNPGGKLGMTIRATRLGQGGSDEYVPYQYLDTAAIPLGQTDDGTLRYLTSFGLMHEDAVKYAGNMLQGDLRALMQQVSASSSPLLKWWMEHSTNTSLFSQGPMGGRRLDDLDPSIGRILANVGLQDVDASGRAQPVGGMPIVESLAAASPMSRMLSMTKIATDKRTDAVSKVLRLLSGVRTEYVTQEMVTRDLRDRLNAIQIAAGARPLTTVSGTSKLQEHLAAQGDTEKVAVLQKIEEALAIQRKIVRDKEKMKSKPLVDMLQQIQ